MAGRVSRQGTGRVVVVWAVCLATALSAGCGGAPTASSTTAVVTTAATTTPATTTTTAPVTTTTPVPTGIPVVIDTDLAMDSVMAVLYLLGRPELDVQAITVSGTGEVHCAPGVQIAADLAALAGHPDVPVACGPEEPLAGDNVFPISWRQAADDAWGMELPAGAEPSLVPAPELLVSVISASPQPVVVFTDGPLTNLAVALRLDPALAGNIAMTFVMGGAVDVSGNAVRNPDAEYNIWVDPLAAAEVLASGLPITLVPLDATNQVPMGSLHLRVLREHGRTPVAEAVVAMLEANAGFLDSGEMFFWDQVAAALVVDESLGGFETVRLEVVTEGGRDEVGQTVRSDDGAEVRVAVRVDVERFEREFLSALAGEDVGPVEAPRKTPMATIGDLVTALFAAAEAGDADAWFALCRDDAPQAVYLVTEGVGRLLDSYPMAGWDPGADPLEGMEVLGEPLVSGDAAAIPVRFADPRVGAGQVEGFLVIVGARATDGVLVAGSASFFAEDGTATDPATVRDLMEAQATAWNADDVDGVLATMTEYVVVWGSPFYSETMHSGSVLRDLLTGVLSMTVEAIGPPVVSGPFAVVPLRLTDEASGEGMDLLGILWVRDSMIALQAFAVGEVSDD
ncbi:MAG: nucleoside hydrolase [Acidimicrobiia bacterium]|nr:nucleoside hydrolase [Acidimicrobiia bacterium]